MEVLLTRDQMLLSLNFSVAAVCHCVAAKDIHAATCGTPYFKMGAKLLGLI